MFFCFSVAGAISIHAAREGGDPQGAHARRWCYISIHAAREGGDETGGGFVAIELLFQSTPPVKAATWLGLSMGGFPPFQSTPPVKAATRLCVNTFLCTGNFNPRRP